MLHRYSNTCQNKNKKMIASPKETKKILMKVFKSRSHTETKAIASQQMVINGYKACYKHHFSIFLTK